MGFLDKAKASATAAMQQGQAKVEAIQQSRAEAEMYRTLGEATYKAQRQGGDPAAVETAMTALDKHFAQVAAASGPPDAPPPSASPSSAPSSDAPSPPAGNFTLDDM